ncbi:SRPBCC family protein [Acinetobacter sp. Marseille-Q1618]|uniref:SRPBCC family protein n=1 Tax=Acinetobacter sp. Marseille-Q1618 TaxID=2697502 RepID=UPI00156DFEA8|nr:SRPBCC family protein [Acinetobacter sp. Marseille-Q1618]
MRAIHQTLCTFVCLAASSFSFAQIVTWADNIPSSLKPFQNNAQQLASYVQDDIFIYPQVATKTSLPTLKANPNPTARFTSAAIIVPVSSQEVAKTLGNYNQYVGLFPTLKSAKLIEQKGNVSQMKYRVSIPTPIPVLNFNEDVVMQHQIANNSISTMVIDAPLPYAVGKLEWFALGDKKTLVTLTQWGDTSQPKGFLFKQILNAIPEAKLGIPTGTGAFVLESLRQRFGLKNTIALAAGQLPEPKLSTAQIQKIDNLSESTGQPVSILNMPTTVPYTHGREMLRFTTTYQAFKESPQQLQKWLQPMSYQSVFPRQIKKITTSALTAQGQDADIKVSIGLGVVSIPFDFKMHFNFPKNNENNFFANGGDLRYLKGQVQLNPQDSGTLMRVTSAVKVDEKAPFLLRAARSLPYHDMLPSTGGNAVFTQKIKAQSKS